MAGSGLMLGQARIRAARPSFTSFRLSVWECSSSCQRRNTAACSYCVSSAATWASAFPGWPSPRSAVPPTRFWHYCKQTTTDPTTYPCFSAYFILMVAVLTILSYCFAARSHTHHQQLLPRQALVHPFKAGTAWSLIRYIHLAAPAPPTTSRHTHILVLLYLYL